MVVGDRPRAAAVCGGEIDRTTEPRGSWSVARIAAALGFFSFTSSRPLAGCGVSLVRLLTLHSASSWRCYCDCVRTSLAVLPCPHEDVVSRRRRISVRRRLKASLGPACRQGSRRNAVRPSPNPRRGRRSPMRLRTPRRMCTRPSLRRRLRRICRGRQRALRRPLPPTTRRHQRHTRILPQTLRSRRA